MHEILKELSVNDELTGIYNKRGIREMGDKSFREAKREGNFISVIMIDIDYFKKYNDYYGHQSGDRCIIAVADTIKESCKRPCDIVGRYGGEEFIVILSGTDYEGTIIVADRIRENIFNLKIPHEKSETEKYISISAGIYTEKPKKNDNIENFIEKADENLYRAKKSGRNRVQK
jgi:diguanylate cyclase (GGDEF)-like protein